MGKVQEDITGSQTTAVKHSLFSDWILIVAHIFLLAGMSADYFLRENYSASPIVWISLISIGVFGAYIYSATNHIKEWQHYSVIAATINHVVVFLGLVFIVPIDSPYILLLPLLLFADGFRFGYKGIVINLFTQSVTFVVAVVYQNVLSEPMGLANTVLYLVVLNFIGIFIWRMLVADFRERKQLDAVRSRAQLEEDRLRSLINSMDAAVIATDNDGLITLYNGATLGLFNTNMTLDNKKLTDIVQLTDEEGKTVDLVAETKKANAILRRNDIVLKLNENDSLILGVSIAPVRQSYGQQIGEGYVITMRDITKEKSLDEQRDDFISVTSHELRTPIAIVEANLSTALLEEMSKGMKAKTKQLITAAHDNIMFLANLVSDLATLARAEKQFLDIELTTIKPEDVLNQMLNDYKKDAEAKGLGIEIAEHKKLHSLLTSELYVHEVMQNFMTNAIKYSREGSIKIGAETGPNNVTRFWVRDTGIGISIADQKKLFTKFFRSEDYRTRETGGTGLGLYIAKKLAERMGGKIWCESEINKGSTFYLEIPPVGALKEDHSKVAQAEIEDVASSL